MVRLTDLVGTSDRKRQQSPSSRKPSVPDRNASAGGQEYLQASDLESIYGISEQPYRKENIDERTSETAQNTAFPAVDQQPTRQTPEFREASAVPQVEQPVPGAQYQPEASEQPDQFLSFETPPASKQPLPGTPAYHQDAGPQAATVSDDRRFHEEADAIHIELLDLLDDIYSEGREGKVLTVERLVEPVLRLINDCRNSNVILRKAVRL